MASTTRHKTKYAGIYYIVTKTGEEVYYARFRKHGRPVDEKIGK